MLMKQTIVDFISAHIPLNAEEISVLNDFTFIKSYPKDAILLAEGNLPQVCYFILKGCIRTYYLLNGVEKTTEFYTENETITPIGYIKNEPSRYFISCVEDTVVAVGNSNSNATLIEKIPKLEPFLIAMSSRLLAEKQTALDDFKNQSAEERYLHLLAHKPHLLQRVPQNYLASYLGITPVSLSRLRKRISGHKNNSAPKLS